MNKSDHFELSSELEYQTLHDLESYLQNDIDNLLEQIENLDFDRKQLQNNEYLEEAIQNIVWEQVQQQLAVQLGEEFIKENNDLHLDLRKSAHIQTSDNFEKGEIATHNTEIDFQQRYSNFQKNFKKDENGRVQTYTNRAGKEQKVLVEKARDIFDKGRPSGNREKGTDMDHTVSAGEMLRDPGVNAFLSKEDQIGFANGEKNLNEISAGVNRAKGDLSMTDFLDNPNSNGQFAQEVHNISKEEDIQLRKKDKEAREELERLKKDGEQRATETGKKSRKAEAIKITGKAFKTMFFQLLSEFLKEVIGKFLIWLKQSQRNFTTFIEQMKLAINHFIANLSEHLLNVGQSVLTMLATSIIGPVVGTLLKVWSYIGQGWKSLKETVDYLRNPENQQKDTSTMMLEIGKIIIAGLTAMGAISLSGVITASLSNIPPLGVDLLGIGSLANIIGIFMGATISGIVGAFILKMIDQFILDKQLSQLSKQKLDANNQKLVLQNQLGKVAGAILKQDKAIALNKISEHHKQAAEFMTDSFSKLLEEPVLKTTDEFKDIDDLLDELL